ncbi:MAG: hypothetical protein ACOCWQ_06020 [Nanoarchaeota archaeon]
MKNEQRAWVITVDMGYGHQRAAYPFKKIAEERIITANSDKIITPQEKKLWKRSRWIYEAISRITSVPLVGPKIFEMYDRLQKILPMHPYRDLSFATPQVKYMQRLINKGLGRSISEYTKKKKIPLLTTFFTTAIAADQADISPVYCVVCDVDINRIWVAENPKKSRIVYLVPTKRAARRLTEYGVPKKNIILTGFPLPKENIGGRSMKTLKKDLGSRLINLDPQKRFIHHHDQLTGLRRKGKKNHPLTLTFVVGGAGAQVDIGVKMLHSLREFILQKVIRVNLVAGTRLEVAQKFHEAALKLGLTGQIGKGINIDVYLSKPEYFAGFSQTLRTTDILWTKTSEMSFYTALGIPIICAPPIGAHEYFNLNWLLQMGSGIVQEDPQYTHEWLFDWLDRGILAKAAFDGYALAPKLGTYNIEKVIFGKG